MKRMIVGGLTFVVGAVIIGINLLGNNQWNANANVSVFVCIVGLSVFLWGFIKWFKRDN